MSWLNEELPAEWPTKPSPVHTEPVKTDTSTTRSSESGFNSVEIQPTVAIQPQETEHTPPWKIALGANANMPEPSPRLTKLFMPPESLRRGPAPPANNTNNSAEFSTSTTSSTVRSEDFEESAPVDRKLKVFGRPDTYTTERLGNLLSSMGADQHSSDDSDSSNRDLQKQTDLNTKHNTKHNESLFESDANLAEDLQQEGRKVLQGLAPFRPSTVTKNTPPESSLDELEQQLTSQSTKGGPSVNSKQAAFAAHTLHAEDTTSSALFQMPGSPLSPASASSHTLDTLPPKLRHWSSIKRNLGEQQEKEQLEKEEEEHIEQQFKQKQQQDKQKPLHHQKSQPKFPMRPPTEADISALGINAPVSRSQTPIERRFVTPKHPHPRSSIQSWGSTGTAPTSSTTTTATTASTTTSSSRDAERTPESFVEKYLTFPRRGHSASSSTTAPPQATRFNTYPRYSPRTATTSSTPNQTGDIECSAAQKDLSYSASFELLAQLIRERMPPGSTRPESLDSLDLSHCELESCDGLDRFAPQLTTLFLNNNAIRSLEGLSSKLVHLDLSFNSLSNMNQFPLSLISTLLLSNNQLESLAPLRNLRALSSLDVSNNMLTSLDGVESLTALRSLNLRGNKLKSIELNLGMLVELDAAQNELVSVRLNTPNLETLDLSSNNVPTLTDMLPNLRELNMQYNGASIDFRTFPNLKVALLDGNVAARNLQLIAGVVETFSWEQPLKTEAPNLQLEWLTNAKDIKLGGGQPRGWVFPPETSVYACQHLDLSACGIRTLPSSFSNLFPFLKSLNLSFNKLDDKVLEILRSCRTLERLSLFGNRLNITGAKLAAKLPQLRVLDSRCQHSGRSFVGRGEYPTDKYSALVESSESSVTVLAPPACKSLQLLDGKWTNHASDTLATTRPGFQSPLYPTEWMPSVSPVAEPSDSTLSDSLTAIDLVEALYVHHYVLQGI